SANDAEDCKQDGNRQDKPVFGRTGKHVGQVGHQQTEEGNGPDQCGGNGNQHRYHEKDFAHDAPMINAQIASGIAPERQNVKNVNEAQSVERNRNHDDDRHNQNVAVDGIEAGEETILQNSEEIWIKHSLDQVGNAAEKHSADDTDKHNEMKATGCSR